MLRLMNFYFVKCHLISPYRSGSLQVITKPDVVMHMRTSTFRIEYGAGYWDWWITGDVYPKNDNLLRLAYTGSHGHVSAHLIITRHPCIGIRIKYLATAGNCWWRSDAKVQKKSTYEYWREIHVDTGFHELTHYSTSVGTKLSKPLMANG